MRVRVNSIYRFNLGFMDRNSGIEVGALVRVINLRGCPPANTMGQCYVVDADNAKGDTSNFEMVDTGSLEAR
jgi:hypothetical protein